MTRRIVFPAGTTTAVAPMSAERAEDKALAEDQKKGIVRARKSIQTRNIFVAPAAE